MNGTITDIKFDGDWYTVTIQPDYTRNIITLDFLVEDIEPLFTFITDDYRKLIGRKVLLVEDEHGAITSFMLAWEGLNENKKA